ncbi:MAG: tyrosine-type recombinase/integrase [Planctomycetota bacterium]|jgi:hypothetical protein
MGTSRRRADQGRIGAVHRKNMAPDHSLEMVTASNVGQHQHGGGCSVPLRPDPVDQLGGTGGTAEIRNRRTARDYHAIGDAGQSQRLIVQAGESLTTRQVERIVRKAAARAGIAGNVSPHWLRHGHASHALDNGIPVSEVQHTLGHASLATTGKYAHARPGHSSGRGLKV